MKRKREKKRRGRGRRRRRSQAKVWILVRFDMDTCFGLYGTTLEIRISCLPFDFSRVLLGFHPNPRFLESRVGKTLNGTRRVWNPPFEVGFMV